MAKPGFGWRLVLTKMYSNWTLWRSLRAFWGHPFSRRGAIHWAVFEYQSSPERVSVSLMFVGHSALPIAIRFVIGFVSLFYKNIQRGRASCRQFIHWPLQHTKCWNINKQVKEMDLASPEGVLLPQIQWSTTWRLKVRTSTCLSVCFLFFFKIGSCCVMFDMFDFLDSWRIQERPGSYANSIS